MNKNQAMTQAQNMRLFSGFIDELKKVSWPTRQETIRLTVVVIGISLIIGIYIGIIDYLLAQGLTLLSQGR